ncbi:hypothetical protein [Mycolicibacterium arseniciresistens]|uniref:Lipoprotein LpqJ n=1 Tax=Mycolicibacterium arseniciresistens TaxID=3062257 RepID=A0ABT8UGE7_9MYCO|nr:hypothetical protein [Mycolicibacterium arseniciresistens]MDO3636859.1 hypothetical protein [Mycolicibacterium arseniciresistens]
MRLVPAIAAVLAIGALVTGCQSAPEAPPRIKPISPTEPTFPTPRPSRTPAAKPPTSTPPAPPPAQELPAENGYVFIQTKSGKTRCQLDTDEVGCEAPFTDAPDVDGAPANGVRVSAGGGIEWVVGNLGDIPAVTLDYRSYRAVGWTIEATPDGTRFTNDGTRHGMFVAVERVDTF